ncbi:MAG: sugar transferase [Nevskia sp.]|uniref:sugar transferase n=1 Tax=Nevskia sp. TaxID=1929292 RepID=UPI004037580B
MSSTAETRPTAKSGHLRSTHAATATPPIPARLHVHGVPRRASRASSNGARSAVLRAVDRGLDLLFAVGLGVVFSPVIAAAVVALGLSDGPVLFCQSRLGKGGRSFKVYKFRTMVPNAAAVLQEVLANNPELRAEWETSFKLKNDPRVTRIGRFLRKTSLDELPQLWNILRGDMSLVGPRPIEPFEIAKYGRFAKHYYAQRPGLTGLWQVSGRSDSSYERRVVLDAYYSQHRSMRMNLGIILKTVRVVLKGSGAY